MAIWKLMQTDANCACWNFWPPSLQDIRMLPRMKTMEPWQKRIASSTTPKVHRRTRGNQRASLVTLGRKGGHISILHGRDWEGVPFSGQRDWLIEIEWGSINSVGSQVQYWRNCKWLAPCHSLWRRQGKVEGPCVLSTRFDKGADPLCMANFPAPMLALARATGTTLQRERSDARAIFTKNTEKISQVSYFWGRLCNREFMKQIVSDYYAMCFEYLWIR